MEAIAVRDASAGDLQAINDIYNHYVLHSACTYQMQPETMADRRDWFSCHGREHPVLVAEIGGRVVGWGSLSRFHPREAYAHTVENSVYVHPEFLRRGVGSVLLKELIERARNVGHHTIVAIIDAPQYASVALHARFEFVETARLKEVGHKFGQWRDVVYMQIML